MSDDKSGVSPAADGNSGGQTKPEKAKTAAFSKPAVILLGLIGGIQVSDPVINSVALVRASTALDFSASIQALAAGVSTLALAATVIPAGLIADRFGRRHVLMAGLLMGAAGELITAFAPGTSIFLLGRVIAGFAMGILFGASYALLRVVASKSLGPAMGMYNVANVIVALTFGFVGGAIATVNWRYSFMLLPVLCVICFFLVPKMIPNVAPIKDVSKDVTGMVLVGIGVAGMLYGISNAAVNVASPKCWGPIVIGVVAFVAFALVESKVRRPVFPLKLLSHPAFLGTLIMGVFWNVANGSMTQMTANMWQYVLDWNTVKVSLGQLPLSIAAIVGAAVAGRLIGRGMNISKIAATGYVLIVLGFLCFLFVGPTSGLIVYLPGMLLAAVGWMTEATTQGTSWLNLSPAKFFGPVTSSKLTVGQFGYALGLSGSTALVSLLTIGKVSDATDGAVSGDGAWAQIGDFLKSGSSSSSALLDLGKSQIQLFYTEAFKTTSLVIAVICAIAGVAMFLLLRAKKASVPVDQWLEEKGQQGMDASVSA